MPWHTPATPGHFCLLVDLVWPDDANPANNRGQENTNVRKLNSPRAQFTFPLRNDRPAPRTITLEVDAYELTTPPSCEGRPNAGETKLSEEERKEHIAEAPSRAPGLSRAARLDRGDRPAVGPARGRRDPQHQRGGARSRRLHGAEAALAGDTLVGGVTLVVEGT
jgi:hypothetical protein